MNYYFYRHFDDYGVCFAEYWFDLEEEAKSFAELVGADYYCTD